MLILSLVDADFNPVIIEAFLSGIYLLLFVRAIWKLLKQRAHGPYICALILLWVSCTSSFIFDWLRARSAFVFNTRSPTSILTAFNAFSGSGTAPFIPVMTSSIISDGILIWRCNALWRSKLILTILITVLVASSVFNLLVLLPQTSIGLELLSVALGLLLSAATTVFATFFIALRIILVTRKSRSVISHTKVIEILVESAAMQSAVLLLSGVINVLAFKSPTEDLVVLEAYAGIFRRMIVGIAPTLIAFRVAGEKHNSEAGAASRAGSHSHLAFKRPKYVTETDTDGQRTWESTIHFDTAQRHDDGVSIRIGAGWGDALSRRESTEKTVHIRNFEYVEWIPRIECY